MWSRSFANQGCFIVEKRNLPFIVKVIRFNRLASSKEEKPCDRLFAAGRNISSKGQKVSAEKARKEVEEEERKRGRDKVYRP
jgi:hypothetical protein